MGDEIGALEVKGQRNSEIYTCKEVPERVPVQSGTKILTLENLLRKLELLFSLRKDILLFLENVIKAREDVLKKMRLTVSKISSDTFFYPEGDENEVDETDRLAEDNPRIKMKKLGNHLVELTDQVNKMSKLFLAKVNKHFNHFRIETFIFQEADYLDIANKETEEIAAILASYDIFLNVMD